MATIKQLSSTGKSVLIGYRKGNNISMTFAWCSNHNIQATPSMIDTEVPKEHWPEPKGTEDLYGVDGKPLYHKDGKPVQQWVW